LESKSNIDLKASESKLDKAIGGGGDSYASHHHLIKKK